MKSTEMTKEQIMRYIPGHKRRAVKDAWSDDDGIWIILREGWESSDTGCHIIHCGGEDEEEERGWPAILRDLKFEISAIVKA